MSAVQAGALPFNGPYAQRQLEALRAYENALAQVNMQRNGFLREAGYTMGPGGHLSVNGADPYSAYSQMQTGIGQDTSRFNQNFANAWGDLAGANAEEGIGGYQHQQFQQAEGGVRNAFAQKLIDNLGRFTQAEQAAKTTYNQANLSNRNALLSYLLKQQKFSKAKAVK